MAAQKSVAMIQQGFSLHAIDYRDVIFAYETPSQIPDLITPLLGQILDEIQTTRFVPTTLPLRPLEKLDLGDLAAEYEIRALTSYFVPTAQYQQAKRGHARLVVKRRFAYGLLDISDESLNLSAKIGVVYRGFWDKRCLPVTSRVVVHS